MTPAPEVLRFADADAVARAAAARIAELIATMQQERGSAAIVLTGGGTGIATLRALREDPGAVDWAQLDIYWGDERFLPRDHPDRNEVQAREALLDHVPVDPARVHPMPADDGELAGDPEAAAAQYRRLLPEAFDVHLLGMGGEGHINSLFPHTPAVAEQSLRVVAVTDSPKPPPVRVTLTLPAVRSARAVCLLVAGADKAEAVAAGVAGADPAEWPVAGARGSAGTTWFVDEAAAHLL
jgi:6-phosphogluconolactonase